MGVDLPVHGHPDSDLCAARRVRLRQNPLSVAPPRPCAAYATDGCFFAPHSKSVDCVGRLAREILSLSDPRITNYVHPMSAWYDSKTGR